MFEKIKKQSAESEEKLTELENRVLSLEKKTNELEQLVAALEKGAAKKSAKSKMSAGAAGADRKEKHICAVMKKAGWTHEYADEQMADAEKRLGISYKDYNQGGFYDIPVQLQRGAYQKLINRRDLQAERRKRCIDDAVEKTGWSQEEASAKVDAAVKRLGITYVEYRENGFCLLSEEEQNTKLQELLNAKEQKKAEKQAEIQKNREEVIGKVMEKTGWDHDTAKANIQRAKARTGCTYNEYFTYKFYELEDEVQDQIFLMSLSKKLKAKYTTDRQFGRMLCNKAATNIHFTDCVKRPWCMNSGVSYEEFLEKFKGCKKIVYKPLGGNWGRGVVGFEMTGDLKALYEELMSYPEGVIEQFVVQHPKMNELSPTAVNTVRIVTISSNNEPITADGKMMDVAYASLKIGGVTSNIVDNLHGGGMVAGIDLEKGELITDGADDQGNVYDIHPVTGTKIKGFQVPYFKEAIAMVTKTIQDKKLDGYLGWDVAISENGPELIETNLEPGVILLTMPYLAEKKGMKSHMEQYYL